MNPKTKGILAGLALLVVVAALAIGADGAHGKTGRSCFAGGVSVFGRGRIYHRHRLSD